MSVRFYMDVHVPRAITEELRRRNIEVITPQQDGTVDLDDEALLKRATDRGAVLFSFDHDFLEVAKQFRESGKEFSDIVHAHPLRIHIGTCIEDLQLIHDLATVKELENRVLFIPL